MVSDSRVIRDEGSGHWLTHWLFSDAVRGLLAPVSFLAVVLIVIDGALPQAEMFLTGGAIPAPTSLLKFGLIGALAVAFILRPKVKLEWFPGKAWFFFVAYLIIDIPHLMSQNLGLFQVLSEYYGYYAIILMLPAVGVIASTLNEAQIRHVLTIAFVLCAGIGIVQHVTNLPLLYTHSADGRFEVITWRFLDTDAIRSFSLFVYSVSFGLFCSLIGGVELYSFLSHQRRSRAVLLYCLAAICCYFTLTRVVYLVFACTTLGVLAVRLGKTVRAVRLAPIFSFVLGGAVAYGGVLGLIGGGGGLENSSSLILRLEEMAYYWSLFYNSSLSQKLFGLGIVQDANVNKAATYPIDNLFMALVLHIGVLGLVLFLLLFWAIWKRMTHSAKSYPTPLKVGVCGLWVSFLALSLFDISTVIFIAGVMLVAIAIAPAAEARVAHGFREN